MHGFAAAGDPSDDRPPAAVRRRRRVSAQTERRIRELAFLHEVAQLAASARGFEELLTTLVDRATAAMAVEVCSLYLVDRDGTRLTLAATNGLDPSQVGRVSLAIGEGITGLAAQRRRPVYAADVTTDRRFRWVRGFDIEGLTSMLSVPLIWNERVVGVLNIQTRERRRFRPAEVEFLSTLAALLVGHVEKGRLAADAEAQVGQRAALDHARAELMSVVTHELRTPLSIVRVYLDLLADAAGAVDDRPDSAQVAGWRESAIGQVTRLDRLVDSILAAVRGEGLTGLARSPFDVGRATTETVDSLRLLLRPHLVRWSQPGGPMVGIGDEGRFRQALEQVLENEAKYAPPERGVSLGIWRDGDEVRIYVTDDGPGVPIEDWETVFGPYVRVEGARQRGSGIGLFAARRLMDAMGGRVWIEANGFGGSRFVLALPAG